MLAVSAGVAFYLGLVLGLGAAYATIGAAIWFERRGEH